MGSADMVQSVIRAMAKHVPDAKYTKNDVIEIVEDAIKNPVYSQGAELSTSTFRVTLKSSNDELLRAISKMKAEKFTPIKEEAETNQAHPLEKRVAELEKTVEALKMTGCIALGDIKSLCESINPKNNEQLIGVRVKPITENAPQLRIELFRQPTEFA